MSGVRVLITGGAGFIGANLALDLASRHADWEITAFDSLHRRGSELNLARLREGGIRFVHGDVREPADLRAAGGFDKLIECSAEPSVMAGVDGSTEFLLHTNLLGAYHCLEEAARNKAQFVFLSTSRVYPVHALNALTFAEGETRFELLEEQPIAGASQRGVSEHFPLDGARTLYGASKLAAELLITEYAESFGLATAVNRCGVVAGPWQMGKVDQGVFTHWMLAFYFRRPLSYLGFGGTGKQVRDLLHVADLGDLIDDQLLRPEHWAGDAATLWERNHVRHIHLDS
jgi:CDP-paratose 2-epimerase